MSPSLPSILANSFEYGWQGVNLILEREVRGEIPGAEMDFHQKFHFIAVMSVKSQRGNGAFGWMEVRLPKATQQITPIAKPIVSIDIFSPNKIADAEMVKKV
jgi:hypothetical protein